MLHCSYDASISGASGNFTVNGVLTCVANTTVSRRGLGAGGESGVDLNTPPYPIHNGLFCSRDILIQIPQIQNQEMADCPYIQ